MEQGKSKIMKKSMTAVLVAVILAALVFPTSAWAEDDQMSTLATVGVQYKTHIQDIGWESVAKTNGQLSGTVGQGKRLEALIVELTGTVPANANIQSFVHVQNKGDLGPFTMGSKAGTEGLGLKMESIMLVLNNLPGYTLKYNVQVENKGWLRDEDDVTTWFSSGEYAGTKGESLRLEAIRIKLVEVNADWEAYQTALAAVDELDYTIASWSAYQEIVYENEVTLDNTNAEIKAATTAIKAAQKNLKKGKDFSAYKAALAAAKEAEYIPETWDTYMVVVNDNVMTQDNSQVEINAATSYILAAQKKLQRKVDLTKYKAALEGVREADYTTASWAYYKNILAANAMTQNNSQTEVDTATTKILEAQKKMVRKFDFTAYKALLAAVKESDYTTISWGIYQKIVDANYIDTDHLSEDATQTKVEEAIKAIETAQKKLLKAGDLTAYEATKSAAQRDDYTTQSWATYVKVLESTVVTKNSSQAEIDAATAKIMVAQTKLVPAGDLSEYEEAKAKVDQEDYTSKSWEVYQKVVTTNIVTAGSGQSAINAATEKILVAQNKLEKKGDTSKYDLLIVAKTESSYTSASWTVYKKVLDANKVTEDSGQVAIDAAVAKIRTAQDKLVPSGKMGVYDDAINAYKDLEAKYTSVSWAAYQKVVNANRMTKDNSDEQIKAAVAKIEKSQREDLVERVSEQAFLDYQTVFNELKETDFTTTSWTKYKAVLANNIKTRDSSKKEVETAKTNIQTARFFLQKKGDISLFKKYEDTVAAYANQADNFKTAYWTEYQTALKNNVVTREKTDTEIDTATKNILAAQDRLLGGRAANLTFYNATLAAVKESDYEATSWSTYMKIVLNNVMTKDNSDDQVKAAMQNIKDAQKNLQGAGSLGEFLKSIDLYQLDVKNKGEIKNNATPTIGSSWDAYEKLVKQYATFDKDGNWMAAGDGVDDVTSKSKQSYVDEITGLINTARKAIVLVSTHQAKYNNYLAAREFPIVDGKVTNKDNYTTNSYAPFAWALVNYNIPEPVACELFEIESKTVSIENARTGLVLRANHLEFDKAYALYVAAEKLMFRDNITKAFIQKDSKYTVGTFTVLEDLIGKYTSIGSDVLDPENSSQTAYDEATAALNTAYSNLIESTEASKTDLINNLSSNIAPDKKRITLPPTDATYGTAIAWSSDAKAILSDAGVAGSVGTATLTATITKNNGTTQTAAFTVTVDANGIVSVVKK